MKTAGYLAGVSACLVLSTLFAAGSKRVQVEGYSVALPMRDELVDHRLVEGPFGRYLKLLTRDVDNRVRSFVVDLDDPGGETTLRGPMHHDTHQALDLPKDLKVDRTLIPIRKLRSSCRDSSIYNAVVSLGLTEVGDLDFALHIFHQGLTGTTLLFRYSEEGSLGSLERLVFRDLDGDCLPELLYIGRHRGLSMIHVFVVTAEDTVEFVQNLSAAKWEVMDLFADHFFVTGSERSRAGEEAGDMCWESAGRYWWDPDKRRLVDEPGRRGY